MKHSIAEVMTADLGLGGGGACIRVEVEAGDRVTFSMTTNQKRKELYW